MSQRWTTWYAGLGLTLGMMLLYVVQPVFLKQLDLAVHDAYLTRLEPGSPSAIPVLVDIDEKSLARHGQWPWPRYRLAALVDRLGQAGVAAVGLDILLAEADRTSPVLMRDRLRLDFGLDVRFQGLPPEIEDNDAIFAHVLDQNPVVLGCYFRFDADIGTPGADVPGPAIAELSHPGDRSAVEALPAARSVSLPLPAFVRKAPVAFFNASPDQDGLVRRVPLLLSAAGSVHASLALRTLMLAEGADTLVLHDGPDGPERIDRGPHAIPISPDGTMPVLFRGGAGTYPTFSAMDILDGAVPAERLRGRIVFIGSSATGLRDIRATPLDPHYPGMETHAAVVDAIISKRFLTIPAWTPGAQTLAILLSGVLGTLAFGRASARVYTPLAVAMTWGGWIGGLTLFRHGLFLSPLYPLLTMLGTGVVLLGLRFWQEERQKRAIHKAFSRYVAPEIVGRIVDSGRADIALAGEERVISVLFSDIRGFTSLSERLAPEQVVALLNRYFTPMTSIVRDDQGTLDKFIGDALMAFWNAPLDVPDHAVRAVRAAGRMRQALDRLNAELRREHGFTLSIGIGIHTGRAFVGNMGTSELLSYTAIGDNVNLASRLEGLCPVYGVPAVVSEDTRALCPKDQAWQALDRVRVKGKAQPVRILTPLDQAEAQTRAEELAAHALALAAYDAGRFEEARAAFSALAAQTEHHLYALYARRCEELRAAPPEDWDGVWTFSAK